MISRILNVKAFLGCQPITGGKYLLFVTDDGRGLELVIPDELLEIIGVALKDKVTVSAVVEDVSNVK